MELLILDEDFRQVCVIDTFESLIWTERYGGYGDFELYAPADTPLTGMVRQDYYVWLKGSEQMMIVEEVSIGTDAETGGHLTVSGRSLESLLDRRIVWGQTVLDGNLQNGVRKLLDENVISPSVEDRRIPGFAFQDSDDPAVKELSIRAQYTGDSLYGAVETICKTYHLGFRVVPDGQNRFVFSLYAGADRSFGQRTNPYVIFSPKFENIANSNYLESKKTLRNVALVAGEGEGAARRTRAVGSGSGLGRREVYADARDLRSETENGPVTDAEYEALLEQRGLEKLAGCRSTKTFEGQAEAAQAFVYGRDFYMGDIVQIVNEYGVGARVRVVEVVRAQDEAGYEMYPTFSEAE